MPTNTEASSLFAAVKSGTMVIVSRACPAVFGPVVTGVSVDAGTAVSDNAADDVEGCA